MHAITLNATNELTWSDLGAPPAEPAPGEVRIRVYATAVNRADLLQRTGHYPPPPGASEILGLECAGIIDAVGAEVAHWQPGDRVCALLAGGGYAEYVNCPAVQLLPVPDHLSLLEAATLPEAFATAWLNLYQEAGLQPGERVLLHAGASGVGCAAIQLCHAFGNPCFVTVGSEEKLKFCQQLGAEAGVNYRAESFLPAVREWSAQQGVDVILDPVGAAYLADNLAALKTDGRLLLIGIMGGYKAELDLRKVLLRRLRIIGSTLRSRSPQQKGELIAALRQHVWPLLAAGRIRPVIDSTLPIEAAEQAFAHVASNRTRGKVALRIRDEQTA